MTPNDLKSLRQRLDLSVTDAARATGYSRQHWHKLESGQHPIQRPGLIRLALEAAEKGNNGAPD